MDTSPKFFYESTTEIISLWITCRNFFCGLLAEISLWITRRNLSVDHSQKFFVNQSQKFFHGSTSEIIFSVNHLQNYFFLFLWITRKNLSIDHL